MEIYKTTNLKTEEFYIGLNKTCDPNYLGSGTKITNQIRKYGRKNFKKEVICKVFNRKDERILMAIENLFISKYIDDPKCINIAIGYKKRNVETKIKYVDRIVYKERPVKKIPIGRGLSKLLQLQ